MGTFKEKVRVDNFSVEDIDTTELDQFSDWLPRNGVMDINIAERGLVMTLHAQNSCQDLIIKVDRLISIKEGERNKAWTNAALNKAGAAGHKVVKNKEWFAQADDDYINACNEVAVAKAAKRWLENKANYFSGWHYAFKTFLKRDYSLEMLGNYQPGGYKEEVSSARRQSGFGPPGWDDEKERDEDDICGEINWQE